jgi:L-ascorbate metabolism protein UlaG (beta-lactamase superfamily)
MPWLRYLLRALAVVALLLLLTAAVIAWRLNARPELAPYDALWWRAPAPAAGLKVSFLGVASVLVDDGETAILTDGFFSRPDKRQVFTGRVAPDLDAIGRGLARAGIPARTGKLAVVIPLHSHYDHALDAPEVAKRTGALLLGSSSSLNIARGWGLPEAQMRLAQLGQAQRFGRFTVTLLAGRHPDTGFTGGEISEPLAPPARASRYLEGQNYTVLVQHEGHALLITGSAGFVPGALNGVQADVVMLGTGTMGALTDAQRDALWQNFVTGVHARRVLPIHWEDFWLPSDQPLQPLPLLFDHFDVSMQFLMQRAAQEGVDLRLPVPWQAMDVFSGLPPARSP